ncbi:hypothetical protein SK128_013553 [Halocaridina rubra]|uniref:Lipase n=1 Tax=Halocaridina rubra TaxID=373956 RepID=A0AAN8XBJ3_HALRR
MTTTEIIEYMGYPAEIHSVTTEDGYILELHRIPYGMAGPSPDRPIAFLHHGILSSSADWIMNAADEGLGYVLADAGYDVWMTNCRGNTYSRKHVQLDPENVDFWDFNWDQMAYYDVPAAIDYILALNGATDLYYIGYSMGTSIFFAFMNDRPEYMDKIRVMAGMAPIAYLDYAQGPVIDLAPYADDLDMILTLLGVGELLPSTNVTDRWIEKFCDIEASTAEVCSNILFLIVGPDSVELSEEFLPVFLAHTPAGASVHTLNHYAQIVLSSKFAKYDYGLLGNLAHYGQDTPPLYNLSALTLPVGLFWSDNDWLTSPQDVARLASELPNVAYNHEVSFTQFNHIDFVWAIHANEYVYTYLLDFLSGY